jgi:16S rRNA (guanine527-N7)-methyltransferase
VKVELLAKSAQELLGLELSQEQLERFELYYRELVSRNEQINLTAITEYEAVQIRHFLDSLTLASPRLRADPSNKPLDMAKAALIDIGAGAGFPGLPLKILYPQIRLTLVESVGKKAVFLQEIAAKLGLSEVIVVTGRAEEIGQMGEHRAKYEVATGRAVANLAVSAEYCLPLVKTGGLFIAPKKGKLTEEIGTAQKAIQVLGGKLRSTPVFRLPQDNAEEERRLIVVEKVAVTPLSYPRRTGLPQKRPIS